MKAMVYYDQLRGRGDALFRDIGVLDMPRVVRAHHIAYEVLTEANKRLAYDRWLIEVPYTCHVAVARWLWRRLLPRTAC